MSSDSSDSDNLTPIPESGSVVGSQLKEHGKRIGSLEILIYTIAFVAVITLVGMVISVSTLVIDQLHFNNQTYRDKSDLDNLRYEELSKQIDSLKE